MTLKLRRRRSRGATGNICFPPCIFSFTQLLFRYASTALRLAILLYLLASQNGGTAKQMHLFVLQQTITRSKIWYKFCTSKLELILLQNFEVIIPCCMVIMPGLKCLWKYNSFGSYLFLTSAVQNLESSRSQKTPLQQWRLSWCCRNARIQAKMSKWQKFYKSPYIVLPTQFFVFVATCSAEITTFRATFQSSKSHVPTLRILWTGFQKSLGWNVYIYFLDWLLRLLYPNLFLR